MDKIKTLSIDIETFSDVDLAKCGVYRYVESPAFEILLFGVSVNGGLSGSRSGHSQTCRQFFRRKRLRL